MTWERVKESENHTLARRGSERKDGMKRVSFTLKIGEFQGEEGEQSK